MYFMSGWEADIFNWMCLKYLKFYMIQSDTPTSLQTCLPPKTVPLDKLQTSMLQTLI